MNQRARVAFQLWVMTLVRPALERGSVKRSTPPGPLHHLWTGSPPMVVSRPQGRRAVEPLDPGARGEGRAAHGAFGEPRGKVLQALVADLHTVETEATGNVSRERDLLGDGLNKAELHLRARDGEDEAGEATPAPMSVHEGVTALTSGSSRMRSRPNCRGCDGRSLEEGYRTDDVDLLVPAQEALDEAPQILALGLGSETSSA